MRQWLLGSLSVFHVCYLCCTDNIHTTTFQHSYTYEPLSLLSFLSVSAARFRTLRTTSSSTTRKSSVDWPFCPQKSEFSQRRQPVEPGALKSFSSKGARSTANTCVNQTLGFVSERFPSGVCRATQDTLTTLGYAQIMFHVWQRVCCS